MRIVPAFLKFRVAAASVAIVVTGCAVAPSSPGPQLAPVSQAGAGAEDFSPRPLYQRPPDRLFGLRQEQGSLGASPDVAPMAAYQQQRLQQRAAQEKALKVAPQWTDLGPANNLGRIIDIAFHPQNGNIVYIASPGGGAHKSTDGGSTWTALTALPYQAVHSIAIDPSNPEVVYFGTGHYSGGGSDLLSMGVYKTTDGGATFGLLAQTVPSTSNTDWLHVTRVTTHPSVANLVFAGSTGGFFRSSDGGATWTKVSGAPTYDIAIDPNNPTKMLRGKFDGSVSYSTNTGSSWSQTQIVPTSTTDLIHTRVKYAKSAPGVVYAAVNRNGGELHRSTDGGLTWSKISTPAHNDTQGFHTNQLWVSPIDTNHIIVGGVDLYRSLDGGQSFLKMSNWQRNSQQTGAGLVPDTPHADHNAVASPPNHSAANPVVFFGTDGGLFTTANARTVTESTGWQKSGGALNISQFVGAAGRRLNGIDRLVGGLQDNGTVLETDYQGWSRIASGDGGFAAIDPIEDVVYGQVYNGQVFRYGPPQGLRSICAGILDADPDACGSANTKAVNFYAPLELDPGNSSRLYFGANSLWRSANPKAPVPTWSAVKPPIAGTTDSTAGSNYINAISVHAADSNVVVVGHNDGQVFRTKNALAATPTWTPLGGTLPTGRMVGALLVDPVDPERLYVGFTGYFADNLWRSDNGGTTWQSISAGLPPGSIYAITRHPITKERLYVGTIWGSYGSADGGNTWPAANDGPHATQIRRLFWLDENTLVAATFGSGLVRANLSSSIASPNYGGMWWNAPGGSEDGWGINFSHQGDTIFASWFTYGFNGKPLWMVFAATKTGPNTYTGTVFTGTGPPFNAVPFDPAKVIGTPVGTATLTFSDSGTATFSYNVSGVAQTKNITRQIFSSPVPTCVWGSQSNPAQATNFQDLWWKFPAASESGWGVNFAHQGDTIFASWFTFNTDGTPLWLVFAAIKTAPGAYSGDIYVTSGPPFNSVPFDPSKVSASKVGTATLTFTDGANGTFAYTVNGISQTKQITRELITAPGTICQ